MKTRFLSILTILLLLAGAGSSAEAPAAPVFLWERNAVSHWQTDGQDAPANLEAHTFDEFMMCSVCGCEILDWGDGSADVTNYDEYGNIVRWSSFDAEGALTSELTHAYAYNADGIVLTDYEYYDGLFYAEYLYSVNEDGEQIPVSATAYNDDGTTSVNYYDELGNVVRAAIFEADGSVVFEALTEYALSDEGYYYAATETQQFASGEVFHTESNQYGDPVRVLNTDADGVAWADSTYDYEYADGCMVWSKQYDEGRLAAEEKYDEFGHCIESIYYEADGTREVVTYNEQWDTDAITLFAADGSIVETRTYEYVYTEDMTMLSCKVCIGDRQLSETEYIYDEDMSFLGSVDTVWNADGTITMSEYDATFELMRETTCTAEEYAAQ